MVADNPPTTTSATNPVPPGEVGNGWTAWSDVLFTGSNYANELTGYFWVPELPPPADAQGQIIYFFQSLQGPGVYPNYTVLLQSVLQYYGGGLSCYWEPSGACPTGWSMQNYYIYNSTVYLLQASLPVTWNDEIQSSIKMTNTNEYSISFTDLSKNEGYLLVIDWSGSMEGFFQEADPGVLESHGVTACNQFPATSPFEFWNVNIYQGTGSAWNTYTQVDQNVELWNYWLSTPPGEPTCGYGVEAGNVNGYGPAWLDLFYN